MVKSVMVMVNPPVVPGKSQFYSLSKVKMALIIDAKVAQVFETIYEENKEKIKSIPAHLFDVEKARTWVELQPERYKLFCTLFLKYQIHVSGQAFLEAVNRLGNDIQSRMLMGKYTGIIVCSGLLLDTEKSNFWVFLLLYPYLKDYLAAIAGNLVECYNFALSQAGKYLIMIPDDMAYSGGQISAIFESYQFRSLLERAFGYDDWEKTNLEELKNLAYLRERYKTVCANSDVLMTLPYLSTRAHEAFIMEALKLAKLFGLEEFPLRFSDVSKRIFPLDKLLEKDVKRLDIPEVYIDNPDSEDSLANNAIYFDHKLADFVSSFPIIYDTAPIADARGRLIESLGSLIKNCPEELEDESCPRGFYKDINYTYRGRPLNTETLPDYLS